MAEDAPAPATLGIGGGGAGGPRSSLTRLRHVISARDQLAIAAGVAQRREPAGPHAGPPHDSRLEFARPEPIYLHGGGFCPRRARRFWLDWAATTYHEERHGFAGIAVEMRWARQMLARGFVDELVHCEAQFTLWARRTPR